VNGFTLHLTIQGPPLRYVTGMGDERVPRVQQLVGDQGRVQVLPDNDALVEMKVSGTPGELAEILEPVVALLRGNDG
jgi:hypothetical protein